MSITLGVALTLPLVGAVLTPVLDRSSGPQARGAAKRGAGTTSAAAAGLAWAVIAAAETPPTLGRVEAEPLTAAAIAGLALLLAARLPRSALTASSSLCGVTVFAATSTTGTGSGPDRPLAVGVAVLVLLATARLRAEAAPRLAGPALVCAGGLVTVGLLLDEADLGAVLVMAGASLAACVAAVAGTVLLLAPAVLYAAARAAAAGQAAQVPDDVDAVGVAGVALAVVAALVVQVVARARRDGGHAPGDHLVPVAAVLAALVLLSQDLPGLRAAGALLAAGAVLAAATSRPLGLVACLPGVVAAVEAFGPATGAVHAAAGAAVLLILGITVHAGRPSEIRPPWTARADWPLMPAGAFAVFPLWGWSGVEPPAYTEAVTTAGAAALVTGLVLVLAAQVPPGLGPALGRLRSRQSAATNGSTNPQAEDDPVQDSQGVTPEVEVPEAGDGAPEEPAAEPVRAAAEHPVAEPPGVVPRRSPGDRGRGGIRVRRRTGRPPG